MPIVGGQIIYSLSQRELAVKKSACRCGCTPCVCRYIHMVGQNPPKTEAEKLLIETREFTKFFN